MKWFKFIIYVQLFLSALGNLILGIGLLAGTAYGEYSGLVYAVAPALRAVDVVIGLALLALAAAAIVVRQRLARYLGRGAPALPAAPGCQPRGESGLSAGRFGGGGRAAAERLHSGQPGGGPG